MPPKKPDYSAWCAGITSIHVHYSSDIVCCLGPDLATLLQQLDMERYQSCFDDEEIDLQVLLHMNEAELDSIGINKLGPRRKLMLAISGAWTVRVGH